jgi:drug/metabolite transporter (DMT)-like permease
LYEIVNRPRRLPSIADVSIILALMAALGYGISDFTGGLASRRVKPTTALLLGYPVATALTVIALPFAPGSISAPAAGCAVLAGLAGLVGFGLMYRLMSTAPLNLVSPITGVLAAVTPLACGVLSGEQPRLTAWFGIGFGLVAVALVSGASGSGPSARLRMRVLLLALASGAGFGLDFALLPRAGTSAGLWPLMIARVSALAVICAVAARPGILARVDRRTAGLAALAGALDAGADLCFLLAARDGYLSLVGVITALYPAFTVLLALLVLRERAGRLARVGLGLAAVSLALIAG